MPAATAATDASAFSRVIESMASGEGSPVAFIRLFSVPTPSGLVSEIASPATAASLRISRSRSTSPVTAMP
jgi:hypothetical protein